MRKMRSVASYEIPWTRQTTITDDDPSHWNSRAPEYISFVESEI